MPKHSPRQTTPHVITKINLKIIANASLKITKCDNMYLKVCAEISCLPKINVVCFFHASQQNELNGKIMSNYANVSKLLLEAVTSVETSVAFRYFNSDF